MNVKQAVQGLEARYPGLWRRLEEIVTPDNYFQLFKHLSDNYSPTLTVSRVQGPLVDSLLSGSVGQASPVNVAHSLRGSGTIGITIGAEPSPLWISAHADVCCYLTGEWDGSRYALTPFCVHRAGPGRRTAVALAAPDGSGPLDHVAAGEMVTDEVGNVWFETAVPNLPLWTQVTHHLPAAWNQETDEIHGFLDNQASVAALLLAARLLSHYKVNLLILLNDEEEGPVAAGNQTFSRGLTRLLNRTPIDQLPDSILISDMHEQEHRVAADKPTFFGRGALFTGVASGGRGAVTPPHLLAFIRQLAAEIAPFGIHLTENDGYVSRSDDVSAMQFTQNISLVGFPGIYPHFDRTPIARCADLVNLTKTLVIVALIAQDTGDKSPDPMGLIKPQRGVVS